MSDIRWFKEDDTAQIVRLARALHEESPRYRGVEFSEAKCTQLIDALARKEVPGGCGFVAVVDGAVVGVLAGLVAPFFFSEEKLATDITVFVAPEHRGGSTGVRLIKAFETFALEQGVSEMQVGISTELTVDRTAGLYERLGYHETGRSFRKELSHG